MSHISAQENSALAQVLGVDLDDPFQVNAFDALTRRYGDRLVSAMCEGWFDVRPVTPATAAENRRKFARFQKLVKQFGMCPLPATVDTVEVYAQYRLESGKQVSTIRAELVAIDWVHRVEGHPQPGQSALIREWKKGADRSDQSPSQRSLPLMPEHILGLVEAVDEGAVDWQRCRPGRNELKRLRTTALFLVSFGTGIRISDLIRLKASWIIAGHGGWARIMVPRSKNHPEGVEYELHPAVDARFCPVRALIGWIDAASAVGGLPNRRLFAKVNHTGDIPLSDPLDGLTGEALWNRVNGRAGKENNLLKAATEHAGFEWDPEQYTISSRSFRKGLATAARNRGAELSHIQRSLAHRLYTTSMIYVENVPGLEDDSAVRAVLS